MMSDDFAAENPDLEEVGEVPNEQDDEFLVLLW